MGKLKLSEQIRNLSNKPKKTAVYVRTGFELKQIGIKSLMKKAIKKNDNFIYLHMPDSNVLDWLKTEGFEVESTNINGSNNAFVIHW